MTRFIPTHEDLQAWLATRTIRGAAIDKALLESCIAEAAGDDAEMSTFLRERYAKNEALAARFVGGFTRTADYTQKTQALSAKERVWCQISRSRKTAYRCPLAAHRC